MSDENNMWLLDEVADIRTWMTRPRTATDFIDLSHDKRIQAVGYAPTVIYDIHANLDFLHRTVDRWAVDLLTHADIEACIRFDVHHFRNATPAQYELAQRYWKPEDTWKCLVGMQGIDPYGVMGDVIRASIVSDLEDVALAEGAENVFVEVNTHGTVLATKKHLGVVRAVLDESTRYVLDAMIRYAKLRDFEHSTSFYNPPAGARAYAQSLVTVGSLKGGKISDSDLEIDELMPPSR